MLMTDVASAAVSVAELWLLLSMVVVLLRL